MSSCPCLWSGAPPEVLPILPPEDACYGSVGCCGACQAAAADHPREPLMRGAPATDCKVLGEAAGWLPTFLLAATSAGICVPLAQDQEAGCVSCLSWACSSSTELLGTGGASEGAAWPSPTPRSQVLSPQGTPREPWRLGPPALGPQRGPASAGPVIGGPDPQTPVTEHARVSSRLLPCCSSSCLLVTPASRQRMEAGWRRGNTPLARLERLFPAAPAGCPVLAGRAKGAPVFLLGHRRPFPFP